ncbi:hypothetical protein HDV05_000090 [Chytridiales sp. JEL 0842]|nr:hypothetical protein HDV05_000090 [Chytridiales sp. JEL 0842]
MKTSFSPLATAALLAFTFGVKIAMADCPLAFNNVMTIVFENEDYKDVMKDPYFGSDLPKKGYLLSNMHGITHPSQPNYIAMTSGSTQFVLGNWNVDLDARSIVDLLENKGLTWKSYQEDYPVDAKCDLSSTIGGKGKYTRKHNPFLSYKSISQNSTRCANVVNIDQVNADAAAGNLPNYMFVTPNMVNSGHDSDIATASKWLKAFLEPKLEDPAFADTLFIVTYDESRSYIGDNQIYTLLLGKGIMGKSMIDNTFYNHYSILSTIEKNFELGNLGAGDKTADAIPIRAPQCRKQNIKNVVVLVFENRSFDTVLGFYSRTRKDVDGIPFNATQNCAAIGRDLMVESNLPLVQQSGPEHSLEAITEQIYGKGVKPMETAGKKVTMSGFCDTYPWSNEPWRLQQVMDGFEPSKVPIFTTLASEYTVFDRWFAGMPGPTMPNRLLLMSARSVFDNQVHTAASAKQAIAGFPQKSIFRSLDENNISWANYFQLLPTTLLFKDTRHPRNLDKFRPMPLFFKDAKEGTLPQFTWLDPLYTNGDEVHTVFGEENDGSPGADFARAEKFLKEVYEALRASPQWKDTLLLVTFDEHGGSYDHVHPPDSGVPSPDDISANSNVFKFDRLGVRVPTLAISPWVKKGGVVNAPLDGAGKQTPTSDYEHCSIPATLKNIFGLPENLSRRDAWAATFDHITREFDKPREDCLLKLPEGMAFNKTSVGVIPAIQRGDILEMSTQAAPVSTAAQCPRAFNNVMYIVFENTDQKVALKDPYFGQELVKKGYFLQEMDAAAHPSQPNYIAMISGSTRWVLGNWDVNLDGDSIVDLLENKGLTWKSYQEDYPVDAKCDTRSKIGGDGAYVRKHNPFISYKNISENPKRCANVVNIDQVNADAAAGQLPNYMFVTPNMVNSAHDSDIPTASRWLKAFLEPKLVDPAYSETLFIVTFDEADYFGRNQIYTVLLGKGIMGKNMVDTNFYNFNSLLATVEDNFGLGNLGRDDKDARLVPVRKPQC